jgi:DNA polymerase
VAKFSRAAALSDDKDHRVRGAFVFCGGAATGRASSYGAQIHNLPRKCAKEPELIRQAMVRRHAIVPQFGGRVTDVLKGMLRPMFIPEQGRAFIVYDWSSIEARVTPWISGDDGDAALQVFREGRDVYVATASLMFGVPESEVSDDQRQQAKVAVLACGFSGGVGAFAAMARIYGLTFSETEAQRMVSLWRRANPWAPPFWNDLETAYTRAIRNPKTEFVAGRVTYYYDGCHLWYALPSGRVLCYPHALIGEDGVTYAKASWKPAADAKEWPRARLWKGLACENVVQASAADILREALRNLDAAGYAVVAHVHDEVVTEHPIDDAERASADIKRIMVQSPAWARNLPLAAGGKIMLRYGK